MDAQGIMAIIGLFFVIPLVIAIGVYYMRKLTHEERMKAIEMGANMQDYVIQTKSGVGKYFTLRFGLLLIGGGLGLILGLVLQENMKIPEPGGVFAMLFIFGGIGLLSAYFIENKKDEKD